MTMIPTVSQQIGGPFAAARFRQRPYSTQQLDEGEQAAVAELKQRDAEVRRHEQAHLAAAGGIARGGASFEYVTGPDGKRYAVGGEVSLDTSEVSGDPQATIEKAQTIKRAALAPAKPSAQDRSVAAQAEGMEQRARRELAAQKSTGYAASGQPVAGTPAPVVLDIAV